MSYPTDSKEVNEQLKYASRVSPVVGLNADMAP